MNSAQLGRPLAAKTLGDTGGVRHILPAMATHGLSGILEDDMPTTAGQGDGLKMDADCRAVLAAMDGLIHSAGNIRIGNALVAQLKAHQTGSADDRTRSRRAAVIDFLRRLDRIERT